MLTESARIARGNIKPLSTFNEKDFDALIFPGGFGCAKNLCTWAMEGDNCKVNSDVEKVINAMFEAKKPIGAMCIAPVILGKLFNGAKLTTGQDSASGRFIEKMGNKYIPASHGEVIVDKMRKLFTTPCYMLDARIGQIAEGTENIVREMMIVTADSR